MSCSKISFAFPTRGMFASMFLPISAESTSMCMVVSLFFTSAGSIMALSATLMPIMIIRSALTMALLADLFPNFPIIPMFNGSSVSRSESPIMVVTTGICILWANSLSSSSAWARKTPPPAQMTGLFASDMALTTCESCFVLPLMLGL